MKSHYSKEVIEHFLHPKHLGKLKNASGVGDTENLRCGDIMRIYIKVKEKGGKEIIEDIKFETMGCAAAIAASDMICQLAQGKTLEEASKVGYKDISQKLGNLSPIKVHCAQLAQTGLKMAIENYKKKQK
ncbi:MAG: iron-sulfur cluster assembly scaffold protein [Candidatus Nealsonbacteria bacterium CG09_land_8_20_14_0_10_42_14]|uniref:Iron-sulfur cluster assembly scaffold protein n=1 Tax=Candidatus Nealsonbacteria bacterium CG09_land_8_20_14_0_10_42_14 TaxID=1974707 RepID=A0A2H0WY27_9BACT|nr:MAG: iron-sulfur cluster assembly scaffold protein [Candidatus Nealsonbacteria bacterium CG09_land_8_20_14_0_10_42_14]